MGGKGKGKAKQQQQQQRDAPTYTEEPSEEAQEQQFRQLVSSLLPPAALLRTEAQLVQTEWDVQVLTASQLRANSVAFVRRQQLPDVLRRIPNTTQPMAMVCTEHATSLGLRQYPCQAVQCTIVVPGETEVGGYRQKFLVQLGFGAHVHRLQDCDAEVEEELTMGKVVFHLQDDATPARVSGSTIQMYMEQAGIPSDGFTEVVVRSPTSATCLLNNDMLDRALQLSGSYGWFCKPHKTAEYPLELVWLTPGVDRTAALATQQAHPASLGLATTIYCRVPRYALRFSTEALALQAQQSLGGPPSLPATFKIEGINSRVGASGLRTMLHKVGYAVSDVVYMEDHVAVFHATQCADKVRLRIKQSDGSTSMAHVKAINAPAKRLAAQARPPQQQQQQQQQYQQEHQQQ
eukprot:6491051-Amphidinium_carterae.1